MVTQPRDSIITPRGSETLPTLARTVPSSSVCFCITITRWPATRLFTLEDVSSG